MIYTLLIGALKIIGFTALFILALIFLVLFVVLFVPIGYKVHAEKYEHICATASVSWLFGILRFAYELKDSSTRQSVKLFGITVWRKRYTDSRPGENMSTDAAARLYSEAAPVHEGASKPVMGESAAKPPPGGNPGAKSGQEPKYSQNAKGGEGDGAGEKSQKKKERRKPGKDKKRQEKSSLLKVLLGYENKREILKQAILLLKRLIKALTHMKLRACLKIGTGQPDTTGYIIGLLSMAVCLKGLNISAQGDFENKVLLGDATAKGSIFICTIVWALLLFIFNRNIFPIVKKIIFRKG